jgi:hypothetical protein
VIIPSAFRRKFDVIAVWKLDRFGRSLRHLVNAIAEFEALGVAFISLRDNLDLGTPAGRLMFQIIGAMAEFERSLIQERLQEAARAARPSPKSYSYNNLAPALQIKSPSLVRLSSPIFVPSLYFGSECFCLCKNKLMKVGIRPSHNSLQGPVEIAERNIARNQCAPPDRRACAKESHFDGIHFHGTVNRTTILANNSKPTAGMQLTFKTPPKCEVGSSLTSFALAKNPT